MNKILAIIIVLAALFCIFSFIDYFVSKEIERENKKTITNVRYGFFDESKHWGSDD